MRQLKANEELLRLSLLPLPKRIEFDMFYFRNPFPPFFARTLNSLGVQRVGKGDLLRGELQSSLNIVRIDV